jgi:hypothetical protein
VPTHSTTNCTNSARRWSSSRNVMPGTLPKLPSLDAATTIRSMAGSIGPSSTVTVSDRPPARGCLPACRTDPLTCVGWL